MGYDTDSPPRITAILLAGGGSSRFGGPKLLAPLGDCGVGEHAARHLAALGLPIAIAVCGPGAPDYGALGFACVALDPPQAPMSQSLRLGIKAAMAAGATAALVALADMPLVPEAHFRALVDGFDGRCIATAVGDRRMPPALFGASLFAELLQLTGDQGARAVLAGASTIGLPPQLALDIDTSEDLAAAAQYLESGTA